jgi:hypothetical protein
MRANAAQSPARHSKKIIINNENPEREFPNSRPGTISQETGCGEGLQRDLRWSIPRRMRWASAVLSNGFLLTGAA